MHYYQFNIADYRKDTAHLSLVEHGIYRTLIDQYFLNEQPLTLNLNMLMRETCARSEQEKDSFMYIIEKYFEKTSEGYAHKRCIFELNKVYSKSDKAKASAALRWKNERNNANASKNNANASKTDANGMRTVCERYANGMLPNNPSNLNNPITQDPITQDPITQDLKTQDQGTQKSLNLKNDIKKPNIVQDSILKIFDFWKTTFSTPNSKLADKRKKIIKAALKNYSIEELEQAITGCSMTPHNMGINDRHEKYFGLHIILKDADQIERFIRNAELPPKKSKIGDGLGLGPDDEIPDFAKDNYNEDKNYANIIEGDFDSEPE